jgi:hypothetical protein
MYNQNVTPLAMGAGGSYGLSFLGMSWFWVWLAVFALIACCSAIRRSLPKFMIVVPDDEPVRTQPIPVSRGLGYRRHARL